MSIQLTGTVLLASDFHLGIDAKDSSKDREKKITKWIGENEESMDSLILVGDIFDYWYEYKQVIPRGFSHFWASMRRLRDNDIPVYFFTGNHDIWMFDYIEEEYGIEILREPTLFDINGLNCLIHHGDGLGPGDHGYKLLKRIFTSKICQFLFSRLHPNFSLWLMSNFSSTSRKHSQSESDIIAKREWLIQFAEDYITKDNNIDYFIFGHRHIPYEHMLSNNKSTYINLGDWLHHYSFLRITNEKCELQYYE